MKKLAAFVIVGIGVVVAPQLVYPAFVMQIFCFILFAAAFNLLLGYAGLLSFGHAAFFGGAAYITGYVIKMWGYPPLLGILAGVLFSAVLGLVFGVLALRRRGIYFAMITLALAQVIYFSAVQLPFTGGENGLQSIPRGMLFGLIDLSRPACIYYTVVAVVGAGLFGIYRIVNSPFGVALTASREDEGRAISLGYDVKRLQLIAFVLSASFSGLAGAVKVLVFQFASLTDVHWMMSGDVVIMTVLGGIGNLLGPIVGASVVIAMQQHLDFMGSWIEVVIGLIMGSCILIFRHGIVGEIARLFGRRGLAARNG